jgi:hypothetical protein
MKQINLRSYALALVFLIGFNSVTNAQVGINTTSPANGALLDVNSSNKGLLVPKVALTNTVDVTTITPAATEGLLVYNTVTSGSLPFQVTPGFYYWNGSQWLRFYNRGYGLKFDQSNALNATSSYQIISGMDTGNIAVPYTGTYQVRIEAIYSCGTLISTSDDGVGQASIRLSMDTNNSGTLTPVKEAYVTSSSKRIGSSTVNSIPQNVAIIYTLDLDVLNTYRFVAEGMEWSANNVNSGTFGRNTSGYSGSLGVADGQDGAITITLVKQQ